MKNEEAKRVYGIVNDRPVYSRNEYVYACRDFRKRRRKHTKKQKMPGSGSR